MFYKHLVLGIVLQALVLNVFAERKDCLQEDDIDYPGKDIKHGKKNSLKECADWCGATSNCKFWTLRKKDNYCWIKSSNEGSKILKGFISGSKYCAENLSTGCVKENNIDYYGRSINDMKKTSEEECVNWCGAEATCKFWVFRKSDKWCWLKKSNADRRSDGRIKSGSKECNKGILNHANWFYIESKLNFQVLDIRNGRSHERNDVVMWFKAKGNNQLWRWDEGRLVSKLNNLALTIKNDDKKKKATVWMMKKSNSKSQKWKVVNEQLVSELNGLVLDVKNGVIDRGNTVWMWIKNNGNAQKWTFPSENVPTVNYCTGEPGCCTKDHPCQVGAGGCQLHRDCKGSIMCEDCPTAPGWTGYHWAGAKCCMHEGSYRCNDKNKHCKECTSDSPCQKGFGDCDSDDDCLGDLKCGDSNCPYKTGFWESSDDCCE